MVELGEDDLGHLAELTVAHLVAQLFPEVLPLADGLGHHGRRFLVELVGGVAELAQELALLVLVEDFQQRGVQRLAALSRQTVQALVQRDRHRRIVGLRVDEDMLAAQAVDEPVGNGRRVAGGGANHGQGVAQQARHGTGHALRVIELGNRHGLDRHTASLGELLLHRRERGRRRGQSQLQSGTFRIRQFKRGCGCLGCLGCSSTGGLRFKSLRLALYGLIGLSAKVCLLREAGPDELAVSILLQAPVQRGVLALQAGQSLLCVAFCRIAVACAACPDLGRRSASHSSFGAGQQIRVG